MSSFDKSSKKKALENQKKAEAGKTSTYDEENTKKTDSVHCDNAVKPYFFVKNDGSGSFVSARGSSVQQKLSGSVDVSDTANGAAHFYRSSPNGRPAVSVNVIENKKESVESMSEIRKDQAHEESLPKKNEIKADKSESVKMHIESEKNDAHPDENVSSMKELFVETDVRLPSHEISYDKGISEILHRNSETADEKSVTPRLSVKSILSEQVNTVIVPKTSQEPELPKEDIKEPEPVRETKKTKTQEQSKHNSKKNKKKEPAGELSQIQTNTQKREDFKDKNDAILASLSAEDINSRQPVKKPSRLKSIVRRLVMALLLVIIAAASVNILLDIKEKSEADKYYTNIRDMFYSDEMAYSSLGYLAKDVSGAPEEKLYSDEGDIYTAPELEILDMHTKYERMLPNLQALKSINSNVFAWIKVEGTRVDYPVVRSPQGNNDYYLIHGLDHTYNVSGAIFTDYNNSTNLSYNRNTCVYGHNMNDGTMFQTIMNFKTRNQFLNGRIELYTANGIYLYTPFSAYDAAPTESFFKTEFADDSDYQTFLTDIKSKSVFYSNITPKVTDKVVTLITCTNTVIDKRFVVHGVLTEIVR